MPKRVFPIQGGGSFSDTWGAYRATTGRHEGVDIFAPHGTPVVAIESGVITKIGHQKVGGNRLWINGKWYYAHLDKYAPGIKAGTRVKAGQVIGYVGTTGDAKGTDPHLHLGYSPMGNGKWENPYQLLTTLKSGKAPAPEPEQPSVLPPAFQDQSAAPFDLGIPPSPVSPFTPSPPLLGLPGEQVQPASQTWQRIAALEFSSPETRRYAELASLYDET